MRMHKILSLPKSIIFNFKVFPFKIAIKLPILISYKVKTKGIKKGAIKIELPAKSKSIQIGFGGTMGIEHNKESVFIISEGGCITFADNVQLSQGVNIRIGQKGNLVIGNNFAANKNCCIFCDTDMKIGKDVLIGYNVNIRTSDGHRIYDIETNENNPTVKTIEIGSHVWIAANVDILKGSKILDDSVVAYRSCVLSSFNKSNCIIGGYPAKILRENINWKK